MVAWKESFQASSTEGMLFVRFCLKFIACEKAKNMFEVKNNPAENYRFKVDNRNTRARCEICLKLSSGVFIVNFEHISHFALMFLSLILSR